MDLRAQEAHVHAHELRRGRQGVAPLNIEKKRKTTGDSHTNQRTRFRRGGVLPHGHKARVNPRYNAHPTSDAQLTS